MNDMKHSNDNEFYTFKHNLMTQKDKEEFLEHISSCDYCSDQFAAIMSEELIPAPKDMKANILNAVKRPEVQLAIKAKETSKRIQLFVYSLKVGTATALALLLLMLSVNLSNSPNSMKIPENDVLDASILNENNVPLTAVIRNNMDHFSSSILDFSNNIMKTEVSNND